MQCWYMVPEDRPTFKELYSTVSQSIEREAGYLQFGFNPFTRGGQREGGEGEANGVGEGEEGTGRERKGGEEVESGVAIQVIPPSLDNGAHAVFSNPSTTD